MGALSLIDVSGEEDDFLVDLASPLQHADTPPRPAPAGQVADPAEQAPEWAQSPKKAKPKGGVNLRKSLAWDKAFFTSNGPCIVWDENSVVP
ncbi:hypothetical protein D1007_12205 [Hordeum vulgare]|nr:hypothetical protein D1007_12205 [Hordeum vulgare]